jgi:hypothetical protein
MSKAKGYPANQGFNVSPCRNLTKKNAWWQRTPPENNSKKRGS